MGSTVYEALNRDSQEIRLVTILPASHFSKPIECIVRTVSLRDNRNYIALSYTWGDSSVTAAIFINGVEHQITTNLESALRHIRDDVKPIVLWVDAICINQSDITERNHQVQLMRQIYSDVKVLAWLGKEEDGSDGAIEFIENWGPKLGKLLRTDFKPQEIDGLFQPEMVNSVKRFFKRPWWERLWTVQEVVLGREVILVCGHTFMSWDHIRRWVSVNYDFAKSSFWELLDESSGEKRAMAAGLMPSRCVSTVSLRISFWTGGFSHGLLLLLYSFQDFKTTDPLDKVYALLGLVPDCSDVVEPDYTLSVSAAYSGIAKAMIHQDNTLDVLRYCGIGYSTTLDFLDLPSWVPNWQSKREAPLMPLKAYLCRQANRSKDNHLLPKPSCPRCFI